MNNQSVFNRTSTENLYTVKFTKDLIPGDVVLHPIYKTDGLLLVNIYTVLSTSLIYHIKIHLQDDISVIVAESRENFAEFINNKVYLNAVFLKTLKEIVEQMKNLFNISLAVNYFVDDRVILGNSLEADPAVNNFIQAKQDRNLINKLTSSPLWDSFEEVLEAETLKVRAKNIKDSLLQTLLMDSSILDIIKSISDYDHRLLTHSINTASISILIGLTIELSDEEIINLALTAMFCNVGYVKIEKSEFERFLKHHDNILTINSHIKNSIEIVSTSKFCRTKSIIFGIMDHHEKYSGQGMPLKKSKEAIHLFGRIIAIAMRYDELTAGYGTRKSLNVREAIKEILDNKNLEFDPNILRIFINRTNIYKTGQTINLGNGTKGTIIGFSDFVNYPQKPIVRLHDGSIIDYSKLKQ
jgi:HD-GYP domain-containing protein (c-di-GMP phosphodiesterase class II)